MTRRPAHCDKRRQHLRRPLQPDEPVTAVRRRTEHRIGAAELRDALLTLGDETDAPQIAKLIVQRRKWKPILTTFDLMALVCEARDFTIERGNGAKLHPAARTFQALRILVNRELANLQRLLARMAPVQTIETEQDDPSTPHELALAAALGLPAAPGRIASGSTISGIPAGSQRALSAATLRTQAL